MYTNAKSGAIMTLIKTILQLKYEIEWNVKTCNSRYVTSHPSMIYTYFESLKCIEKQRKVGEERGLGGLTMVCAAGFPFIE